MPAVRVSLGPGRRWVMIPSKVPITASTIRECETRFVPLDRPLVEPGAFLIEALRNDQGVMTSVVIPSGGTVPTGRIAPEASWFRMLKGHIRQWLVLSPESRLVQVCQIGVEHLRREMGGSEDPALRGAIQTLQKIGAEAAGELSADAKDDSILRVFYDWVVTTSANTGKTQQEILAVIEASIRTRQVPEIPDLDQGLLRQEYRRFLSVDFCTPSKETPT